MSAHLSPGAAFHIRCIRIQATGGNFSALESTHCGARRVFKSSGFFCCQKNNTQDRLSLLFCCVGRSCSAEEHTSVRCPSVGWNLEHPIRDAPNGLSWDLCPLTALSLCVFVKEKLSRERGAVTDVMDCSRTCYIKVQRGSTRQKTNVGPKVIQQESRGQLGDGMEEMKRRLGNPGFTSLRVREPIWLHGFLPITHICWQFFLIAAFILRLSNLGLFRVEIYHVNIQEIMGNNRNNWKYIGFICCGCIYR